MYPIFRLINSYDFPCFNRIRLEISLQFRKKVEHTLLQTKWLFDDNLWALSIHPTTNKAHCFNQFIAPSALLLKKKIHWTCKWIILIEWRLLKKYVTCLHRDAVRKTDVHSFFFSFFFLFGFILVGFWNPVVLLLRINTISSVRQDELRQKILTVNERFSVPNLGQIPQKKKPRYSRTIPKTHFYRQLFIERYTRNCGFASKQPIKHLPHQRIMKRITTELVLHYLNLYRFSIFNWIKFILLP